MDQFHPISGGLPGADARGVGARRQSGFKDHVPPGARQHVQPLQHQTPGREVARRTVSGQAMCDFIRIDELKRLRPFPQESVDEGGLAGAVRSGEEDEGGHLARFLTRNVVLHLAHPPAVSANAYAQRWGES